MSVTRYLYLCPRSHVSHRVRFPGSQLSGVGNASRQVALSAVPSTGLISRISSGNSSTGFRIVEMTASNSQHALPRCRCVVMRRSTVSEPGRVHTATISSCTAYASNVRGRPDAAMPASSILETTNASCASISPSRTGAASHPPPNDSPSRRRGYRRRSALERINNRIDPSVGLERHFIRG
jgi:hypothetical protein